MNKQLQSHQNHTPQGADVKHVPLFRSFLWPVAGRCNALGLELAFLTRNHQHEEQAEPCAVPTSPLCLRARTYRTSNICITNTANLRLLRLTLAVPCSAQGCRAAPSVGTRPATGARCSRWANPSPHPSGGQTARLRMLLQKKQRFRHRH